ncbi:hypothetical protein D3C75_1137230 [compost metagenome]
MVGDIAVGGFVDLLRIDHDQIAFQNGIGPVFNEIITFACKQIIQLVFAVKMVGGHGVIHGPAVKFHLNLARVRFFAEA